MGVKLRNSTIFNGVLNQSSNLSFLIKSNQQIECNVKLNHQTTQHTENCCNIDKQQKKILIRFFKSIPLPLRFSPKAIVKKLEKDFNSDTNKIEREKKYEDFDDIMEILLLFLSKSKLIYGDGGLIEIAPYIAQFNSLIKKHLKNVIDSIEKTKEEYSKIYLSSNFPPEFIEITTYAYQTLQTFLYFINQEYSDLNNEIDNCFWDKSANKKISDFDFLFFEYQPLFFVKIFEKILNLFRLQIFIAGWNSNNFEEFFSQKINNYKLKRHKYFFKNLLIGIREISEKIHELISEISYIEDKDIPIDNTNLEKHRDLTQKIIQLHYV